MRKLLTDYREFASSRGFSPNIYSTGAFFSVVFAYHAYDGDHWGSPELAGQSWIGDTIALATRPQIQRMSKAQLELQSDLLALQGATLFMSAIEARTKRDRATMAHVSRRARAYLIDVHGVDPAQRRLDDLSCVVNPLGMYAPCEEMKWFATGGKVGHYALTR